MHCMKNRLFVITVGLFFAINACKNKSSHFEDPVSATELDPRYKNLNDSIHQFPGDASLYLRRAVRLTLENSHELAYPDFLKAWSLKHQLEIALPFAANLSVLAHQQERLNLLDTIYHLFPSNTQVSRLLAEAYANSGRPDRALILYNNMIARDSLDPEILFEKALLLEQMRDTVQAIATLIRAYSNGIDTYGLELAKLYAEQKNPMALEICNFILKKDSARLLTDPFFIKGIYYANIKQYPKALVQFDSCILRDWKTTDAYLEKGRIYFHRQNYNAAMQTFNMAITVTNTDPDAYFWLGRCYEAKNMKTEAVNNYQKAVSLDKDFTEARQRLENINRGFADPSH
jgi:tetratricopeptide (TPR) repeat protein